jgi:hypothetical protein
MRGVSCQERNLYCVRLVTFASGERVPLLIVGSTGEPLFQPTLYATTHLRARGRATETIHQALRSIMVLQLTLHRLEDRRRVIKSPMHVNLRPCTREQTERAHSTGSGVLRTATRRSA